jgi:hypothetical protein
MASHTGQNKNESENKNNCCRNKIMGLCNWIMRAWQFIANKTYFIFEFLNYISGTVLAVATGLLVWVAYWQWDALEKTDTTLNKTLVAANRAYIAPGQITFIDLPQEKTEIRLQLTYENIGREPAIKLGRWVLFGTANVDAMAVPNNDPILAAKKAADEIEKSIPDDPCKVADTFRYLGVIFPSHTTRPSATIFVPAKYMTANVVSGKDILIVKGCFVYDTFGYRRESRYCYWYWAGAPKFIQEKPIFQACEIGNDACPCRKPHLAGS